MDEKKESSQRQERPESPYFRFGPEVEGSSPRDVVLIRVIGKDEELNKFSLNLSEKGFLPVLFFPEFFPTDYLREVGTKVFKSGNSKLDELLEFIEGRVNLERFYRRVQDVPFTFRGGDYVYSPQKKIFVYSENLIFRGVLSKRLESQRKRKGEKEQIENILKSTKGDDWKIYPVDTQDIKIERKRLDLDFLLSLFLGKDGKAHMITTYAFNSQVPRDFNDEQVHFIPDQEVFRAGLNIADLRQGSVLVLPHHGQAPSTHTIISKYAHPSINIIEAPPDFLDLDGGPRCAISSFAI